MEFDNIETIKRAVEIDAGVALLPEPTVLREVEAKTLAMVPLDSDELVRPLGIIHRRGKELGSTTRRFIELLQAEGQQACQACQPEANVEHPWNGNGTHHHEAAETNGTAETTEQETEHDLHARPRRVARIKAK
jgi:hypothetical protein